MRHLSLPPFGVVEMTPRAAIPARSHAHSVAASLTSNLLGTTSGSEGVAKPRQSSLPLLGPPTRSDTRPQATEKRTEYSSLGFFASGEADVGRQPTADVGRQPTRPYTSMSQVQSQAQEQQIQDYDSAASNARLAYFDTGAGSNPYFFSPPTIATEDVVASSCPRFGSQVVLGVQRAAARDAMQEASDLACQSMVAHSPPMQSQLSSSHPRPLEISSALLVSGKTRDGFPRNAPLMLPRATALGSAVTAAIEARRASDQQRLGASPNTISDHKASRSTVSGAGVEIVLVDMPRDMGKMENTGGKGGRTGSISRRPPRHSNTPEADAQAFRDLLGGTTRKDARREGEGQEAGRDGAVGVDEGACASIAGRVRITQEEGGRGRMPGHVQPISPREHSMAAIMSQRLAVGLDKCLYDCIRPVLDTYMLHTLLYEYAERPSLRSRTLC
jgi:hypothetical protein